MRREDLFDNKANTRVGGWISTAILPKLGHVDTAVCLVCMRVEKNVFSCFGVDLTDVAEVRCPLAQCTVVFPTAKCTKEILEVHIW